MKLAKVLLENSWRPLTQDVANNSNLGICKIGTNLIIDSTTGTVSTLIKGVSRSVKHTRTRGLVNQILASFTNKPCWRTYVTP